MSGADTNQLSDRLRQQHGSDASSVPTYGRVVCLAEDIQLSHAPRTERRLHLRLRLQQVSWLRGVRLSYGSELRVVNVSSTGILLETDRSFTLGSKVALELLSDKTKLVNIARVVRCRQATSGEIGCYCTAFTFDRPMDLQQLVPAFRVAPPSKEERLAATLHRELERLAQVKPQIVIVRHRDGRVVRGWTQEFHPRNAYLRFSLTPSWDAPVVVPMSDVKVLVFVRDVPESHIVCFDVEKQAIVRSRVDVIEPGRIELRQTSSGGATLCVDAPGDAARRWIASTTGSSADVENTSSDSGPKRQVCDHGGLQ